jgi:hypothetical protein
LRVVNDFGVGLVWLLTGAEPRRISRLFCNTPVFNPPEMSKFGARERRRCSTGTSNQSKRSSQKPQALRLTPSSSPWDFNGITHGWCSRWFLACASKKDPIDEAGQRYIELGCPAASVALAQEEHQRRAAVHMNQHPARDSPERLEPEERMEHRRLSLRDPGQRSGRY